MNEARHAEHLLFGVRASAHRYSIAPQYMRYCCAFVNVHPSGSGTSIHRLHDGHCDLPTNPPLKRRQFQQ
jgi:hypothetical protein